MNDDPFFAITPAHEAVGARLAKLEGGLWDLEITAKQKLPGVGWDFSELRTHLNRVACLVRKGLALKAHEEHQNFSVCPPGRALVKLRGKPAAHLARRRGYIAGKVVSAAKAASSRANLELARVKRWKKKLSQEELKAHTNIKALRRIIQRLKYRELVAARARQASPTARTTRSDNGKRAARILELRNQVQALEEKWPRLRSASPQRTSKMQQSEEWLIPPPLPD